MISKRRLAIITGANGFLGKNLVSSLRQDGWVVRSLVRQPQRDDEFHFDLLGEWDEAAFDADGFNESCLIHCAHATNGGHWKVLAEVNFQASIRLYERSQTIAGCSFVYISSMAAHPAARSAYGRSKLRVEQEIDLSRSLVIKPGTIVGNGGLFARIARLTQKLPLVPVFYASNQLQTIGIHDLCRAILLLIDQGKYGIIPIAHPRSIPVLDFYRLLAEASGRIPWLLRLPGGWVYPGLKFAEHLGLRLPVTSENLLGLRYVMPFDTAPILRELNLDVRDYAESLKFELSELNPVGSPPLR